MAMKANLLESKFEDANTEWILVQRKVRAKKPKKANQGNPSVGSRDGSKECRDAARDPMEHCKGQRSDVRRNNKRSKKRVKFDLPS